MPTRSLTPVDNFNTISIWLNQNLSTPGITPISSQLINVPRVPGLYFWFLKAKGYSVLSNEISGIEKVSKSIIYSYKDQDLVYVGSAGTGKNKGGHLRQRLQWHISQKHSTSAICSKAISSFRAGISALISNDLILFTGSTTELEVDRILEEYFHVLWIPYESINSIDNDENILIGNLRPLLNCNKNPNALNNALPNPTKTYKKRRNLIRKNTKARLGCPSQKLKTKQKVTTPNKINSTAAKVFTVDGCIEFKVPQHKSIQDVISGMKGLPEGKCKFIIQNAADSNQLIYENSRDDGWRTTGNGKQNIYKYFSAPDTKRENLPRWKIIQNEMNERKIKEIVVIVCGEDKDSKESKPEKKPKMTTPPRMPVIDIETMKIPPTSEKKLIILACSNGKHPGGFPKKINDYFGSDPSIATCRTNLGMVSSSEYMEALDRYKARVYPTATKNKIRLAILGKNLHLLIISGLYGILKYNDHIAKYDKKLQKGNWKRFLAPALKKYIGKQKIPNENVYLFLSKTYGGELGTYDPRWLDMWVSIQGGRSLSINRKRLDKLLNRL